MKKIRKLCFYLFISFLVYIVIVRYINPPITIFQLDGMYFSMNSDKYDFRRDYVSWDELGANIKLAAISGEDQKFLDHSGFDWENLNKSITSSSQGTAASTISQQMTKNVFFWQGNGIFKYIRKGLEFPTTFIVELFYPKQRILELYLNIAEAGPGIYGVEAASQYYFNKPSKDLTKIQAAKIIACFPNPKIFIANESNEKTNKRAKWIVKQMNNLKSNVKIQEFIN